MTTAKKSDWSARPIGVDILVEAGAWGDGEELRLMVEKAVATAVVVGELDVPEDAELSLVFTSDARIRKLNRDYRGIDKPTNVLSFPIHADDDAPGGLLGDLIIARETALREADEEGKDFDDHLTHLLIHGLLHLFGYDHEIPADAETMERLETEILAALDIPDPYAGTEPDTGPDANAASETQTK